ncbi:MAG: hypothetical protein NWE89_13520 [Candidatus Bathyarchaeota archaeon]|nr:hypothetical protein [Candidatus Bathyarchaeota archaeon]
MNNRRVIGGFIVIVGLISGPFVVPYIFSIVMGENPHLDKINSETERILTEVPFSEWGAREIGFVSIYMQQKPLQRFDSLVGIILFGGIGFAINYMIQKEQEP